MILFQADRNKRSQQHVNYHLSRSNTTPRNADYETHLRFTCTLRIVMSQTNS